MVFFWILIIRSENEKICLLAAALISWSYLLKTVLAGQGIDLSALIFSLTPLTHFDTGIEPRFDYPELEIKYLPAACDMADRTNHFCILRYEFADKKRATAVLWKERHIGTAAMTSLYRTATTDMHHLSFVSCLRLV